MADIVFINHQAGVKAAEILEENIAYKEYDASYLAETALSSNVGVIGANWRETVGGMPPTMMLKTDRYYIIQDTDGNIYKLKFTRLGNNDGGVRGYPELTFDLVQEAQ